MPWGFQSGGFRFPSSNQKWKPTPLAARDVSLFPAGSGAGTAVSDYDVRALVARRSFAREAINFFPNLPMGSFFVSTK